MIKYIWSMIGIVFLLMGCQSGTNTNNDATGNDTLDREMQIKNDSYKQYTQSQELGLSDYGDKQHFFSSNQQREIIQYINSLENVDFAYVNHGEDKVNIMVSVKEGPYDEYKKKIKQYVRENYPQGKVDVFIIQSTD